MKKIDNIPADFADGLSRLVVKNGIVYLEFYQEELGADAISVRNVVHRIAAPLKILGELAQSLSHFEAELKRQKAKQG